MQPGAASEETWPSLDAVSRAVARRLEQLLGEHDGVVAEVGRVPLGKRHAILGPQPHSLTATVVVGACVAAGGDWRRAVWAAVAGECLMAAADLLDDVADGELHDYLPPFTGGVVLTAAGGLLALAAEAAARSVEDGLTAWEANQLARVVGAGFARATEGQAQSLIADATVDAVLAHQLAASKSGPLGELLASLGACCATDDRHELRLHATFGWHLAVMNQLLNDARDAGPDGSTRKRDVRDARPTVPVVFAGCQGAPSGLAADELATWERDERSRIVERGGVEVAHALAQAERLHAAQALDELAGRGRPVGGLRNLIG